MDNAVFQFLAQLIVRLFSKSPWFFRVIQIIAIVLGTANVAVNHLITESTLANSKFLSILSSSVTLAVTITTLVLAQLPVSDNSKNITKIQR